MNTTIALDLTRRHFTHTRGLISIIGTWLHVDDDWKPCMVLIMEHHGSEAVPCILPADMAFEFDPRTGHGPTAFHMARQFVQALRLVDDPKSVRYVWGLINDYLDDLIRIPPMATADTPVGDVVGELTVIDRNSGKAVREVELTDV